MKKFIKQLLRENLSYGYFKDKTSIPYFDALKNGLYDNLPTAFQKQEAHVVFMNKNEYLYECAKLQRSSVAQQETYIDKDKVEQYMTAMKSGSKFNMGYLDYVNDLQEGRHRIVAASALGQINIPVLVIEEKDTSNGTLESKIGEWRDLQKDNNGDFIVKYNLNEDNAKLLRVFANDYDYYLLDKILSEKLYNTSKRNYDKFHRQIIGSEVIIDNYNISDLFPNEITSKLVSQIDPETGYKEFSLTPEQMSYFKFIIGLSLEDGAKRFNRNILNYINFQDKSNAFIKIPKAKEFTNLNDFNNAKDLLIAIKPFNVDLKEPFSVEPNKSDILNNLKQYPNLS